MYRGVMRHYTENRCRKKEKSLVVFKGKIARGFINDMVYLVNFTRALKNLKICTLRNSFVQGI